MAIHPYLRIDDRHTREKFSMRAEEFVFGSRELVDGNRHDATSAATFHSGKVLTQSLELALIFVEFLLLLRGDQHERRPLFLSPLASLILGL
jgi:hypothetical protein